MVQAMAGDDAAYRVLLKELSVQLRGFYKRRLRDVDLEVEDLVQETLLAIHNQRHTYDTDRPFTAWCHAIAKYKLIDLLRRRRRKPSTIDVDDETELFAIEELDAAEARRDLGHLIEKLPDRWRLPIVHMKIEGRSVAEVATLIGMSEAAVKVNVHRGLAALAKRVSSRE
jgi:RNA polymerase sigma-70 factor (ECF subfamily)